jgi:hypothetical protein
MPNLAASNGPMKFLLTWENMKSEAQEKAARQCFLYGVSLSLPDGNFFDLCQMIRLVGQWFGP